MSAAVKTSRIAAVKLTSASGTYVASPGVWGCGEGYRVWDKYSAASARYRGTVIADVWSAEQAQTLLDALDALDAIEAVKAELDAARRDYADLAYAVDNQSLLARIANVFRR